MKDCMYSGGDEDDGKPKKRDTEAEDKAEAENFKAADFGVDPERGFNDDRGCTDILCLIIFFAFLGSMGFLTSFAHKNGNTDLMFASFDGDKIMCGFDEKNVRLNPDDEYFEYTKLFLSDLTFVNGRGLSGINKIFDSSVCVKECPKTDSKITEYRPTKNIAAG
jgi:hypothetical protein